MSGLLADRVAIVTGGASGLGAAITDRLLAEGARVVVADLVERSDGGSDGTGRAGANGAEHVRTDVRREGEVRALVGHVMGRHARLDILVCSAAVETRASVTDTSDEEWRHVLDVNLKGGFLCMKHGIPRMVDGGGGSVVLLGSVLGAIGAPAYAAYCASKGAIVNLAKQAAIEHAADGVRVNVVAPSAIRAGLFLETISRAPDPEAVERTVATNTPMRRLGTTREVTDAVLFLASEASSYTSGAVLPLDGGMAARRT